jgi:hypothetical protein
MMVAFAAAMLSRKRVSLIAFASENCVLTLAPDWRS